MFVWCWFVVVVQIISFQGDPICDAHFNSKCIEMQQLGEKLMKPPAVTSNFNPVSLQFHMLGCPIETIPVPTFFKKKDLQHGNTLLRIYYNCKYFNNIARLLPGNPMVNYHWICRIQV